MNDKSRPDIEQCGRVVGLQPESRAAYKVFRTLAIYVYVDRQKRRSTVLPVNFKRVLEQLL